MEDMKEQYDLMVEELELPEEELDEMAEDDDDDDDVPIDNPSLQRVLDLVQRYDTGRFAASDSSPGIF